MLEGFQGLLLKWNATINLISRNTVDAAWSRHIEDSVQLLRFLGSSTLIVDLGSGGGLPAIPLAIVTREYDPPRHFTLIESDRRKSEFLRTAIRTYGLNAEVITSRIEEAPAQKADLCMARALAPCTKLFGYADRHLAKGARCLFMKGANLENELVDARQTWSFSSKAHQSQTDRTATILEVEHLVRL
ncbi:MAG: 16S rRNA (guanine(527)-N(7))-methyltransferase RsmG [Pseudomonadota bacterium]